MINRILHIPDVASLRDAVSSLVINPQTALRLSGVIKIKLLRSFFMVCNCSIFFMFLAIHGHSRSKKKLLIIAVKLLIIAVKYNNFWLIPGQFLVIPVKKRAPFVVPYFRFRFGLRYCCNIHLALTRR